MLGPDWYSSVDWAQTANQSVAGSIPSRDTCLGYRPGPQYGVRERQPHIDISLPLFLLLFPFLWKWINKIFKKKECWQYTFANIICSILPTLWSEFVNFNLQVDFFFWPPPELYLYNLHEVFLVCTKENRYAFPLIPVLKCKLTQLANQT